MSQAPVWPPAVSRKEKAKVVLREIFSPAMIICFVVVMTLPFWGEALTYLCLRSLLIAPSGLFIWLAIVGVGGYVVWAYVAWFRLLARFSNERKALKTRAQSGDEEAAQGYAAHQRRVLPMWHHATAMIGFQLLLPMALALILWSRISGSPDMVRVDGHLRQATPREGLELLIGAMERRGLFGARGTDD